MIENIFTASPAEIDGQIALVNGKLDGLYRIIARCTSDLSRGLSADIDEDERRIEDCRGRIQVLDPFFTALAAEYDRRGGWTRLYVVDNNNGHAHRTTACSTTYATTDFYWFPEHSGKTDEEIVALTGAQTCLVCFGSQREAIESGRPSKIETPNQAKSRAEREAQAAVTAAKKAKAAGNAITDMDGSPLRSEYGVLKTLRSAQIAAVDALEQAGLDEIYADQADNPARVSRMHGLAADEYQMAEKLIKAIAAKQGRPEADVRTELAAKAAKKLAPAHKDEAARTAAGKTAEEWYRK